MFIACILTEDRTEDECSCPCPHHHDRWWIIKRQDEVDQYRCVASSHAERFAGRSVPHGWMRRIDIDPLRLIARYSTSGHDDVHMGMSIHLLSPGMQDQNHAWSAVELLLANTA